MYDSQCSENYVVCATILVTDKWRQKEAFVSNLLEVFHQRAIEWERINFLKHLFYKNMQTLKSM